MNIASTQKTRWFKRRPSPRTRVVLGVLPIALVVLIALFDWNWFKRPLENAVQARTGRTLHIDGNLDVDLGRVTRVTAERIRFANAAWSEEPVMASADRVDVDVEIWPLLLRGASPPHAVTGGKPKVLRRERFHWPRAELRKALAEQPAGPRVPGAAFLPRTDVRFIAFQPAAERLGAEQVGGGALFDVQGSSLGGGERGRLLEDCSPAHGGRRRQVCGVGEGSMDPVGVPGSILALDLDLPRTATVVDALCAQVLARAGHECRP